MKFIKILFLIIISHSNVLYSDNIFEPNQLPNIKVIDLNTLDLDTFFRNKLLILQKERFFVLHTYKDFFHKNIKCKSTDINEYKDNFKILLKELDRYKINFFKNINFNYLVLCKDLQLEDYYTAGIPNNRVATLIFDISLKKDTISRSIHHEIFHMIKENNKNDGLDRLYEDVNDKKFVYQECSVCNENLDTTFVNNIDGFVSSYASNTLEEDQAELFAAIMSLKNFNNFYLNDQKIFNKKKLIENYYINFLK